VSHRNRGHEGHYACWVPNRLAAATSSYLQQHADNPVDWYEWGDAAFARARELDRPIFLSIGYAACHWCHVMAHESFENDAIAAQLNEHFVAIKVDREERPDVDAVYMAATQAVSGHGGWPMSVFLTPEGRTFMAGTYYPPKDRGGQPGFSRLLSAMSDAWHTQRAAIDEQATNIEQAIERDLRFVDHVVAAAPTRSVKTVVTDLVEHLVTRVDDDGGFGPAPKFPRPSYVEALLVAWHDPRARLAAQRTLDAMSRRGLYDHVRGGFARYSVDGQWHVPHFEKMLSDQALLASAYFRADRAAGGGTEWATVAVETLRFVTSDLRVDAGYASSLDADSDGSEGAHVTWTRAEVADALLAAGCPELLDDVCRRWRINDYELFEGRSIPQLADGEPFATPPHLLVALDALRAARAARPQPSRDNKVVLEWNAMFVVACLESDDDEFRELGVDALLRLTSTHFDQGRWYRTETHTAQATAADVAWLLEATLTAFEATGDDEFLSTAPELVAYLLDHYWDGERPTAASPSRGGGVCTTANSVHDLAYRSKEIFDGATPSAHAVAATALAKFARLTEDADAEAVASRLLELAGPLLDDHPAAVPDLVRAYGFFASGRDIVIPGDRAPWSDLLRSVFVPFSLVVSGRGSSSLLAGRDEGLAYLCESRVCQLPARTTDELRQQIDALELR